jgi:hypothetical protein
MAEPHVDRPDRRPSAPSPQRRRAGRRLTDALATARRVLAFVDGIDPHVRLVTIAQVAVMAAVSRRTIWRDIRAKKLVVCYGTPGRPRVLVDDARAYAGLKHCAPSIVTSDATARHTD